MCRKHEPGLPKQLRYKAKSTARSRYAVQIEPSPVAVSQKREYFRYSPETIGDFDCANGELETEHKSAKPQLAGISRISEIRISSPKTEETNGFLYLIPTFCVRMRPTGPRRTRPRDLNTPTLNVAGIGRTRQGRPARRRFGIRELERVVRADARQPRQEVLILSVAAMLAKSPDRKRAVEYLAACDAVPITVIERDGVCCISFWQDRRHPRRGLVARRAGCGAPRRASPQARQHQSGPSNRPSRRCSAQRPR